MAEADANVTITVGTAEAEKIQKIGTAEASVIKQKGEAISTEGYVSIEVAKALASSGKLVPEISTGSSGSSSMADTLLALTVRSLQQKDKA